MVASAPRFYHIAREIVELTRDKIFVAHNASFDYYFLKNEFYQLGYDFQLSRICTVRNSRKVFPGLQSYSLGKLCNDLGIIINDRHRALGDATATTTLFEMLLQEQRLRGIEPLVVSH
jgi:DNA polymerase-3 subunit epsilon